MIQKTLTDYNIIEQRKTIVKIHIESDNYPNRLRQIKDPPKILYAIGNISLLNRPIVAIVGTRNPSDLGRRYAKKIAEIYSKRGFVIASGLAIGVDTIAMKTALDFGAHVIAVLPSPLTRIIPDSNKELAESIVNHSGLLISEYPNNAKIKKYYFVKRNRIISGISQLVIVIETDIKGGTMHTVRFAKEQGKKILVADIPSPGNQKLIKEGYEAIRL